MLLTINMGNTRTKGVLYKGEMPVKRFTASTSADVAHYRAWLSGIEKPEQVYFASVVPAAADALKQALVTAWQVPVKQIQPREDLGVTFGGVDYRELGSDLFVNAVASTQLFGGSVLNVDLGSASTFCVIKNGLYLGTSIVPGMELSIRAMIDGTALLPNFELVKPRRIINTDTISCLQSGIYYGYFELVRGMIQRVQEEQGPLKVVLTGGIGTFLYEELSPYVNHFEPDLTVEGLRLISQRFGDCQGEAEALK